MVLYIIAAVLFVVGVILFFVGRHKSGLMTDISDTQTSTVADLIQGSRAELKGFASSNTPLRDPAQNTPVVYYSYKVEERRRDRNSSGNTTTSWRTVDSGESSQPFYLTDESGSILVDPTGAKVDAPRLCQMPLDTNSGMGEGMMKTILGGLSALTGEARRITVHAIAEESSIYVLGQVIPSGEQLRLGKGDGKFFISTKSEKELLGSLGWQSKACYAAGGLLAIGGIALAIYKAGKG